MKIDSLSSNPISPNQPEGPGQVKNSGNADQASRAYSTGSSSDSANVSDRARLLSKARTAFQSTSDVNQEKVADIKKRIQDGKYSVPTEELANRLHFRLKQMPPE